MNPPISWWASRHGGQQGLAASQAPLLEPAPIGRHRHEGVRLVHDPADGNPHGWQRSAPDPGRPRTPNLVKDDRASSGAGRGRPTRGGLSGGSPGRPRGPLPTIPHHFIAGASHTLYYTGSPTSPPREWRTGGDVAARPVPSSWSERTTRPRRSRDGSLPGPPDAPDPVSREPHPCPGGGAPAIRVHPTRGPLGPVRRSRIPEVHSRGATGSRPGRLLWRPLLEPRTHASIRRVPGPFPGQGARRAGRLVRDIERVSPRQQRQGRRPLQRRVPGGRPRRPRRPDGILQVLPRPLGRGGARAQARRRSREHAGEER